MLVARSANCRVGYEMRPERAISNRVSASSRARKRNGRLPDYLHRVLHEEFIRREDRDILTDCLRDQLPIKGVVMV